MINQDFVDFHKLYWNEEIEGGVGKIHLNEQVGIIGLVFAFSLPIRAVNFLDRSNIRYWQQWFRKRAFHLTYGTNVDTSVEKIQVASNGDIITIAELNLELKQITRQWRCVSNEGWNSLTAKIELQPCSVVLHAQSKEKFHGQEFKR